MKSPFVSLFILVAILAIQPALSQDEPAAIPLFRFDAALLPIEEVTTESLKAASSSNVFGEAKSAGFFQLSSQGAALPQNIVDLPKVGKALQIRVPASTIEGGRNVQNFFFQDGNLGNSLDPTKPLRLEIELQQGPAPARFSVCLRFRTEAHGWIDVALAAVLNSEGNYRVFKTGHLTTADSEDGSQLPVDQPVTLSFEITPEGDGMSVISKVSTKDAVMTDIATTPEYLSRCKLDELTDLTISVEPLIDSTDVVILYILSVSARQ